MTRFLRRLLGLPRCPLCRAAAGESIPLTVTVSAAPGRVILTLTAAGRPMDAVYRPGAARSFAAGVVEAADLAEASAAVAAENAREN
jgi:hypothetical protein